MARRANRSRYTPGNPLNRRGSRADRTVDEVAVQRYVAGDHTIVLTAAERAAAIDLLDARGYSIHRVAEALGFSCRTVVRRRRARRVARQECV